MKITVLVENTCGLGREELQIEHGLSLYIETENQKILFDTGQTDAFANNAEILEILMEKHGFSPYFGEWWHFSDTTAYPVDHVFEP